MELPKYKTCIVYGSFHTSCFQPLNIPAAYFEFLDIFLLRTWLSETQNKTCVFSLKSSSSLKANM